MYRVLLLDDVTVSAKQASARQTSSTNNKIVYRRFAQIDKLRCALQICWYQQHFRSFVFRKQQPIQRANAHNSIIGPISTTYANRQVPRERLNGLSDASQSIDFGINS